MAGKKNVVDEVVETVEMTEEELAAVNEEAPKKTRGRKAKTADAEAEEVKDTEEAKKEDIEKQQKISEPINDDPVEKIDPDALIARNTSRFAFEVDKATNKQRREMYRSEHVVTEFGDEEVETEATILRKDYLELVASAKSNKILEGKIMGYRYAGEVRKSTLLAEIEYGSGLFMVLIPSYLLYDYEVGQYVDPGKAQIIENNIKRRFGGRVKFVVRHVDEKEQVAYADRLEAQSLLGYLNYLKPQRDDRPRVVEDMIVKAQVIYTVSGGIIVDALGVDIKIPSKELSHMYVGDARQEFSVGDSVNVRVTNIQETTIEKNGTKYRMVKADGSVKAATPNRKKQLYPHFQIGGVYAAEITYIEDAGVYCRLRGNVDCLCALPRYGKNPKRGDTRMVKITEKNDEQLFIYGVLVNN